ncbi:MAG: chorismate lyase [Betaproteobacteria bacterium]|nr:chorismate lyase [Betaproteobacteria bacterium]
MDSKWRQSAWTAGAWRPWLTDHGSLTRRLTLACPSFRVQRLSQRLEQPMHDELRPLDLHPGRLAMVREVLLLCGDTPLVFAHSVIPCGGLRGPWVGLSGLGHRPLGAALFADPRIRRHPLEFRLLDRRHPLYRRAALHLPAAPATLWARRSRFVLKGRALMVTEVFLPATQTLTETTP